MMDPPQAPEASSTSAPNLSPRHSDEPEVKRVRRNGIASSCEPCRKSKLACNHELPCSRCVRGRKECHYHPNPMSRTNGTISSPAPPLSNPPPKEPIIPGTPETKRTASRLSFQSFETNPVKVCIILSALGIPNEPLA